MGIKQTPLMTTDSQMTDSIMECLDALNHHRTNARAIAGIMELCRFIGAEEVDLKTLGNAAAIIVVELDEVTRWTRLLEERLRA
jgi:hypothetical protein